MRRGYLFYFIFFARVAERDGSRLCFPNCRLYMCRHLEGCTLLSWCRLKARQRNTNKYARTKTSQTTDHERELLFIDFFFFSAFFFQISYMLLVARIMLVGVCFYRSTVLELAVMLGSKLSTPLRAPAGCYGNHGGAISHVGKSGL